MSTHLTLLIVSLFVCSILLVDAKGVNKRFMWDILTLPFDSQHRCLECYNCNCHWKHHPTECSGWSMDCVIIVDHQDCDYPYHSDGGWGTWTSWSNCSETSCGLTGTQTRSRLCNNPAPHNCGRVCLGDVSDARYCDPCNPRVPPSTPKTQSVTTSPTASSASQTTIPPAMPALCNKFCAIGHVASSSPYEHPDASSCPDGTHSGQEALPLVCCIVPPVSTWKEGVNVMSHCNTLPLYTPIAIFTFGHYVTGTAGVFTGCLSNGTHGFQMTVQTCGKVPYRENIVKTRSVDGHPDAYFTIQ